MHKSLIFSKYTIKEKMSNLGSLNAHDIKLKMLFNIKSYQNSKEKVGNDILSIFHKLQLNNVLIK